MLQRHWSTSEAPITPVSASACLILPLQGKVPNSMPSWPRYQLLQWQNRQRRRSNLTLDLAKLQHTQFNRPPALVRMCYCWETNRTIKEDEAVGKTRTRTDKRTNHIRNSNNNNNCHRNNGANARYNCVSVQLFLLPLQGKWYYKQTSNSLASTMVWMDISP